MTLITIHPANARDFSTLGFGALTPEFCRIEEHAGGMYELVLRQPIGSDGRADLIKLERIIRAPAPVRETPEVTLGNVGTTTIVRDIWKVRTSNGRLRLRSKPNGHVIGAYESGTEVVKLAEKDGWCAVIVCDGGQKGYMYGQYLQHVGERTEIIRGDAPGKVIRPRQVREQLFRISSVTADSAGRYVEAHARHISCDLAGAIVCKPLVFEGIPAQEAVAEIIKNADHDAGIEVICGVNDPISGDFTGKSVLESLLDPEWGIAAQCGAKVVRDNFDVFLLPDTERDRGIEIRYGKNLLSAALETDADGIVTRVIPIGKDEQGADLIGEPVDSARIGDFSQIRTAWIEYDVKIGREYTRAQALAKLTELAQAEFDAGCDLASVRLDAEFVRLELAREYRDLADKYALHLYDTVPVIDREAGIDVRVRMVGYVFDALRKRYEETELGDIGAFSGEIFGYELANGSVGGTKIVNGTIGTGKLRDLSVTSAKIASAAITSAKIALLAVQTGHIEDLAVTAAKIAKAAIGSAQIQDAAITNAKIQDAAITNAKIADAAIDSAKIQDAAIGSAKIANASIETAKIALGAITTALIRQGAVGTAQIADGSITDAKIVELTANKITAGTIAVERLVIVGSEKSIVYTINEANGTAQLSQTTIDGGSLTQRSITADRIVAGAITANEIAAATILANNIAANAVTADKIASDAITARHLAAGAIETGHISAGAMAQLKIASSVSDSGEGTEILLNKEEMRFTGPVISFNVTGGAGDTVWDEEGLTVPKVNSPSVLSRYDGPTSITVNPNAAPNGVSTFRSLGDVFDILSNKFIPNQLTVYVSAGYTEAEQLVLRRTSGAQIIVRSTTAETLVTISGYLLCQDMQNRIAFQDIGLSSASTAHVAQFNHCNYVRLTRCALVGPGSTATYNSCVYANDGGNVYAVNCTTSGMRRAYHADTLARIIVSNGVGSDIVNTFGPYNGGTIAAMGTIPAYTGAQSYGDGTGTLTLASNVTTSSGDTTTAPTTTSSATLNTTDTRTNYAGSWYSSSSRQLSQGIAQGVTFKGAMWFDISAISGKTIKAAALRLHRLSGVGAGSTVTVCLGVMSNSSASGSLSSVATYGAIGTVDQNGILKVTVPTEAVQHLANGTGKGLYVYSTDTSHWDGRTYSRNYAQFSGHGSSNAPQLAVTYA